MNGQMQRPQRPKNWKEWGEFLTDAIKDAEINLKFLKAQLKVVEENIRD